MGEGCPLPLPAWAPLRLPAGASHLGRVDNVLDYLCSPSLLGVWRVFYLHTFPELFMIISPSLRFVPLFK